MGADQQVDIDWRAAKETQRRYDRAALGYDLRDMPMELFARALRRRLWAKIDGGRVLEVGVGTGRNLAYHPPQSEVSAIDISPRLLAKAVRKARKKGQAVEMSLMDAQRLAFGDGSFDSAAATFVFCSVPDPLVGLAEVRRVLKPGGRFVAVDLGESSGFLGHIFQLLGARHGEGKLGEAPAMLREAGFEGVESGRTKYKPLWVVRATKGG